MAGNGSEEIIEIILSEDGSEINIETINYAGQSCSIPINDLTKALGKMSSQTHKPEFYDKDKTKDVIITGNRK